MHKHQCADEQRGKPLGNKTQHTLQTSTGSMVWAGFIGLASIVQPTSFAQETFQLEEASMASIQKAMDDGALSSVELLSLYLNRIAIYDQNGVKLNSVPVINPRAFEEAAAADELRKASGSLGALHGVPFTVKDTYNIAGMPTIIGSPAVQRANLIPSEDAASVKRLKTAGAILLGRANLAPMGYGGDDASVYGSSVNPYNPAGNVAGSSYGSAVSTAANLAVFGMCGESTGSVRGPAGLSGVIGFRPSLGIISKVGTAPLDEETDVVGIMTRGGRDLAEVLDVVVRDYPGEESDADAFFPSASQVISGQFTDKLPARLDGIRIGVPKPSIGTGTEEFNTRLSPRVQVLWDDCRASLESLGATVVEVDWPWIDIWRNDDPSIADITQWFNVEYANTYAHYLDEFIRAFDSPTLPGFAQIEDDMHTDSGINDEMIRTRQILLDGEQRTLFTPFNGQTYGAFILGAFESAVNTYMRPVATAANVDVIVYPASSLVGPRLDSEPAATFPARGFFNDFGNLGLPGVSVPMGTVAETGLPASVEFISLTRGNDQKVVTVANAYAAASRKRIAAPLAPPLPGETIEYSTALPPPSRPELNAPALRVAGGAKVTGKGKKAALVINGGARDASGLSSLKVYVNGKKIAAKRAANWKASVKLSALRKFVRGDARTVSVQVVAKDIYGNTSVTTKNVKLPKEA